MGVFSTVLDKLQFWRRNEPDVSDVAGCFTLPGAELDQPSDDDRGDGPEGSGAW